MIMQSFNPRAREGRDHPAFEPFMRPVEFQSTRPRGARHGRRAHGQNLGPVSIHAPARGATPTCRRVRPTDRCFNPRAREGRDIRARGRRSTCRRFNPRAREGRDSGATSTTRATCWFQSTRPRGARPAHGTGGWESGMRFNPRAREGRDRYLSAWRQRLEQFQSTRPRGARRLPPPDHLGADMFQSTRPRGARRNPWRLAWRSGSGFNPRAREGRDLICEIGWTRQLVVSIHAPARGATLFGGGGEFLVVVSIHAPARGAT